jgi:DNA-binding XRE family transcriptional regulator
MSEFEKEHLELIQSNCFWAGYLIDLPKDEAWRLANGIVDEIKFAIQQANGAEQSTDQALHKHSVMPSLHLFKERRDKLNLTLRQVAEQTKVSAATISRIERGEGECSYHNVVQLDDYYCRNGA